MGAWGIGVCPRFGFFGSGSPGRFHVMGHGDGLPVATP
jgi:hypothetical protein